MKSILIFIRRFLDFPNSVANKLFYCSLIALFLCSSYKGLKNENNYCNIMGYKIES